MPQSHSVVPFLEYGFIKQKAVKFRKRFDYHSPVYPIEEIIDIHMGLDIAPIPGLHTFVESSGMLSSDMRTIFVDEYCYEHFEEKYRFTLAHEIGHVELHTEIYKQLSFERIAEWREAVGSLLTDEEYGRLELQADMFAGIVLVPSDYLLKEFRKHADSVKQLLTNEEEISFKDEAVFKATLRELSRRISLLFSVAPQVIESRLFYEGLQETFRQMLAQK